ncbi:MAG: patatin-like phospholipase family protein [Alphaproteobacteria bacterium]|nr:patatin-like phospholipase family protein [Alphaproteobacteria bacterium]
MGNPPPFSGRSILSAVITVLFAAALLAGCATSALRVPVPIELVDKVEISGIGQVRSWGDVPIKNFKKIAAVRAKQIRTTRPKLYKKRNRTEAYLAISGGGSNGAFTSGLLNGWTASGNRPVFEVVSGVSTGALIAPFAFLGPSHDKQLREIYTLYSTDDILQPQVLAGLFGANAVSSTKPLEKLIAKYVDRRLLRAIAREHRKGRRLLVGTTNLDAQRPVVWNMGAIAQRGTPDALKLFRQVLLASAALPGLFPPVYIKVASGEKTFEEMHVDGGTTDNAFLLPLHLNLRRVDKRSGLRLKRKLYIIANEKMDPSQKAVQDSAFEIAGRSINTLIKQQTEGDLIKMYLRAKNNSVDYNVASIPNNFKAKSSEPFDIKYMTKLYDQGFKLGQIGDHWKKMPPGI